MSSKVGFLRVPTAQRSQALDALNNMISQDAADKRSAIEETRDEKRFQLQLARQKKQDALAEARTRLADQRYADSIAYRDKKDRETKQDQLGAMAATIKAASIMPIDYEETKMENVVKNTGDTYNEYDVKKMQEDYAANPELFGTNPTPIEPGAIPEDLNKNKEIYNALQRIQTNPNLKAGSQKNEAIRTWLKEHGYEDVATNEDSKITRVAKYLGGAQQALDTITDFTSTTLNPFTSNTEDEKYRKKYAEPRTKRLQDILHVNDPIQFMNDKANAYKKYINSQKRVKKLNERQKLQAKQDAANVLSKYFKGKKNITKTVQEPVAIDPRKVVQQIEKESQKQIQQINDRKDLNQKEKYAMVLKALENRNAALKDYSKSRDKALSFKEWKAKEDYQQRGRLSLAEAKAVLKRLGTKKNMTEKDRIELEAAKEKLKGQRLQNKLTEKKLYD